MMRDKLFNRKSDRLRPAEKVERRGIILRRVNPGPGRGSLLVAQIVMRIDGAVASIKGKPASQRPPLRIIFQIPAWAAGTPVH